MKLLEVKGQYGYSEAGQTVQLRTALLNKQENGDLKPMFAPVMCRDYYSDLLHSQWAGVGGTVCGFVCDPTKQKIDRDALRLQVKCASACMMANVLANLAGILHPIEKQNGFKETIITPYDKQNIILEGDPIWLTSSLLMATYTLLIRISGYPIKDVSNWYEEILVGGLGEAHFHNILGGKWKQLIPRLGKFAEIVKGQSPCGLTKAHTCNSAHHRGIIGWFTGNQGNSECNKWLSDALAA